MHQKLQSLIIGLFVGLLVAAGLQPPDAAGGHRLPVKEADVPEHISPPKRFAKPEVDLIVHRDVEGGWNLEVRYQNLKLAPGKASLYHVPGEGHAHLYINGQKITRLYGSWYHIPAHWLAPGEHEATVVLSSNNHKEYAVSGELIADSETIYVFE